MREGADDAVGAWVLSGQAAWGSGNDAHRSEALRDLAGPQCRRPPALGPPCLSWGCMEAMSAETPAGPREGGMASKF